MKFKFKHMPYVAVVVVTILVAVYFVPFFWGLFAQKGFWVVLLTALASIVTIGAGYLMYEIVMAILIVLAALGLRAYNASRRPWYRRQQVNPDDYVTVEKASEGSTLVTMPKDVTYIKAQGNIRFAWHHNGFFLPHGKKQDVPRQLGLIQVHKDDVSAYQKALAEIHRRS